MALTTIACLLYYDVGHWSTRMVICMVICIAGRYCCYVLINIDTISKKCRMSDTSKFF